MESYKYLVIDNKYVAVDSDLSNFINKKVAEGFEVFAATDSRIMMRRGSRGSDEVFSESDLFNESDDKHVALAGVREDFIHVLRNKESMLRTLKIIDESGTYSSMDPKMRELSAYLDTFCLFDLSYIDTFVAKWKKSGSLSIGHTICDAVVRSINQTVPTLIDVNETLKCNYIEDLIEQYKELCKIMGSPTSGKIEIDYPDHFVFDNKISELLKTLIYFRLKLYIGVSSI